MSKPKSNSVLDALPENQRTQLESWLFEENISYKDASARLLADFNVRCGPSSVGEWYQRRWRERRNSEAMALIRNSRKDANDLVEQIQKNPSDTYSAFIGMIGQIAFEASMDGQKIDLERVKDLGSLVVSAKTLELKEKQIALNERRVKLLEQKAAAFDKAKEVIASTLTPEEQRQRLKEILK